MRASILRLAFLLPLTVRAANIVLGNDDGWAEVNIRTFYDALTEADESVVLAAPAENESGTGMSTHLSFLAVISLSLLPSRCTAFSLLHTPSQQHPYSTHTQ